MSLYTRRLILAFIALAVALLTLPNWAARSAQRLVAQDAPTLTPTFTETPTGTPTGTPTATSTMTPFFTPTWTPTWTPTFPIQTPIPTGPTPTKPLRIVTEITQPQPGDAVAGLTAILGTALTNSYRKYDLHISPAGLEAWQWLTTSFDIVNDGHLTTLDSRQFADGLYDLRLRTIRDDGNYVEAFVRGFEIRNANPPTMTPAYDAAGVLIQPPPVSPLDTPTPTPRSRIIQNIPGVQGIFAPETGQPVSGYVNIVGTANGKFGVRFDRYEISISPAGEANWTWLYTGQDQIWQNTVYVLDTTQLADGYYDVRLRIVYEDGNYDDYVLRYLDIDNTRRPAAPPRLGVQSPKSNSTVGSVVDFTGAAVDPNFQRWELYWSPAGQESWAFLSSGERPVVNGLLARLDLSKLTGSRIDVMLRIVRQDGNYSEHFARNLFVAGPPTPTPIPASPLPTPTPLG